MQTELIGYYCEAHDTTFIMQAEFVDGEPKSIECVGWYCGEPNDDDNNRYAHTGMKNEY